jgi:hypothetical protein
MKKEATTKYEEPKSKIYDEKRGNHKMLEAQIKDLR